MLFYRSVKYWAFAMFIYDFLPNGNIFANFASPSKTRRKNKFLHPLKKSVPANLIPKKPQGNLESE